MKKYRWGLIALLVFVFGASYLYAQIYISPDGKVMNGFAANITWIHIQTEHMGNDAEVYYREYYLRSDLITGIGGPFPWWDGNTHKKRMHLYTIQDHYPSVHLTDIGEDQHILYSAAIETIVRENPGGIVELSDYLP